jgi:hypothetical protein
MVEEEEPVVTGNIATLSAMQLLLELWNHATIADRKVE